MKKNKMDLKKVKKLLLSTTAILTIFLVSFGITTHVLHKRRNIILKETNNKKNTKQTFDANKYNLDKFDAKDVFKKDGKKLAFLTFDDGPSDTVTPKVLDILKKYEINATFFVVGNLAENNKDLIEREVFEGHSIGNHTYSHNYKSIYSDTSVFINEVDKTQQILKNIIGENYNIKLVRFPGGAFGEKFEPYKQVLEEKGYYYIDWNALNGDAEAQNVPKEKLIDNIKTTTKGKNHVVILMHDGYCKETTAEALPYIIEYLKSQGYEFKALK